MNHDRVGCGMEKSTQAVHSGIFRSQFGENAEAMFLTQGYVYDSAEQAEERFHRM